MTDFEQTTPTGDLSENAEGSKPTTGGRSFGSGFRNNNSRCYNCGQTGHLSYDCHRGRGGGNGGGGGFGGNGGFRGSRGQRCYNCQQEGHISRECPNPPGAKSCYNCNGEGTLAFYFWLTRFA